MAQLPIARDPVGVGVDADSRVRLCYSSPADNTAPSAVESGDLWDVQEIHRARDYVENCSLAIDAAGVAHIAHNADLAAWHARQPDRSGQH